MATITRQPFAPLDGPRLQNLTSLKNRQNAVSNAPVKRKASDVDTDDFENIDPSFFSKRSKGTDTSFSKDVDFKPSAFTLTKASFSPSLAQPLKAQPSSMPRPRSVLQPRSPAAKLNTSVTSPSLTAPAGRSPTRGSKRIGILSKRRTTRVAPPVFGLGGAESAAPFSLDAALKGTISNYAGRSSSSLSSSMAAGSTASLHDGPEAKNSWFFDIHEDTPEQEMTNLLQHSTCTLDISSDEESEQRATRERAEGRDKENIPPADDISQTSRAARRAENEDDMVIEKARGPLLEMNAADYYAEGCDDSSVIIVPADDDAEAELPQEVLQVSPAAEEVAAAAAPEPEFEFAPELKHDVEDISVDAIMGKELPGDKAAVLAPIEGSGESFELWESGSAKDDCEIPGSPALAAEALGSE